MHGHDSEFGSIKDADNIDTIKYRIAYYNNGLGKFTDYGNWLTYYDFNVDGVIWNKFPGAITNNNGVYTLRLLLNTTNYQNCLIQWQISPIDTDLVTLYGDFYLQNTKTKYGTIEGDTSGTIYIFPSTTFSGDYANEYNQQEQDNINQENNDKIIDSINDINNDDQVDGMLSDFFNSGDLMNDIGYSPLENPFTSVILDILEQTTDVLLGDGNVTLDISFGGEEIILHSQDFNFPNSTLFTLIHLICNGFFIYGLYKYGFKLYEWINSGRLQNLVNEANDHQYYWF